MASAHDVAALIIDEQHHRGRTIDKMQLQKLLYIVEGAHLLFWDESAFREDLRAYVKGPVVEVVEGTYRDATTGAAPLERALGGDPHALDEERVSTVLKVLDSFGTWTAPNLERYVKRFSDNPWRLARKRAGVAMDDRRARPPIERSDIAMWFHRHGVDPNPDRTEPWRPTADRLAEIDQHLDEARQAGVYGSEGIDELRPYAEQALAARRPQ